MRSHAAYWCVVCASAAAWLTGPQETYFDIESEALVGPDGQVQSTKDISAVAPAGPDPVAPPASTEPAESAEQAT